MLRGRLSRLRPRGSVQTDTNHDEQEGQGGYNGDDNWVGDVDRHGAALVGSEKRTQPGPGRKMRIDAAGGTQLAGSFKAFSPAVRACNSVAYPAALRLKTKLPNFRICHP